MSLFIGIIGRDFIYMAADARTRGEIPYIGIKTYDCVQKLGTFSEQEKLWAADVGLLNASSRIFHELLQRSVSTINDLSDIEEILFKKYHIEMLDKYNLTYQDPKDLSNCLTILFGGIDKENKPKLCLVDSANEYKKHWFVNPGDFVFNPLDNGKIDAYLRINLAKLTSEILMGSNIDYVIARVKDIFRYVSCNDIGVSPLTDFVKISPNEVVYKEFHRLRKFIHRIRYNLDNFLYLKDAQGAQSQRSRSKEFGGHP